MIGLGWKNLVLFTVGLGSVLFLHGAVPYVMVPTLGQAVWTTGFSQSFVNNSLFSIYATNFGIPEPAAPAFGLAGAYPAGLLIAAGLHPADAYSGMVAAWLTLAFIGAWRIALFFGLSIPLATLAAVLWMSMPIVWAHAYYSMLSIGIALLPFYFLCALRLFEKPSESMIERLKKGGYYVSACVLAVFMDGYSFMMFFAGSGILAIYCFLRFSAQRSYLFRYAFMTHIFGFALAYALYAWHVGRVQFEPSDLNFFRSFGVDLAYLAIPTKGAFWIWDMLGLSVPRSDIKLFGDGSVWITTFCIPLILIGLVAWFRTRRREVLSNAFLILAVFGFYLALGPSLKLNTIKPEAMQRELPGQISALMMSADLSLAQTGNAWLYKYVPGFQNMRAAYRWSALGVFGFWALLLMSLAKTKGRGRAVGILVIVLLLLANLPHLDRRWDRHKSDHEMFKRIDSELVADMKEVLQKGELVAFLPYRNDFLVNYLSSRVNIRTYNIGGDKNLVIASQHWPQTMRHYGMNRIDSELSDLVLHLLSSRKADAVVLPYIDMLRAAYSWPVPLEYKGDLASTTDSLTALNDVLVDRREYYALVRLTSDQHLLFNYPLTVANRSLSLYRALGRGWHDLEREHVWSKRYAELELPIPDDCPTDKCNAILTFSVFGASEKRPVRVIFKSAQGDSGTLPVVSARSGAVQRVSIPLPVSIFSNILTIEIPDATSPYKLQGSPDKRTLGVALRSVELNHDI